ncbi:CAP domain-containing protein [Maritimibacter sp. UBA3975]|uniref:CAP domain-containing protein n=1 Tax=Maritimibacter sp. UBA3975 TaxID=1946833 RepID=UPI000C0B83D3|nr:CAP domain-containing protein [Maritimibacter sp. UBA3975]MAM62530.1 hypothetical protein [Maritimibacter sp.]|tara:strand:+ start:1815 stop:2282 length:468 start_codon:yes stop_codon:yes gene_type:complete
MRPLAAILCAALIAIAGSASVACDLPSNAAALMADAGRAVNTERENGGVKALRRDARLDRAAQRHACWMSSSQRFSHEGAGRSQPFDRIASAGYTARLSSENIAHGQGSAAEVVKDWMTSGGHRSNIMRADAVDYGVGVALLRSRPVWVMLYAAQ